MNTTRATTRNKMYIVKKGKRPAPQLDMKKLEEAVHYICSRATDLGAVKLNKILYYSDMLHYVQHGSAITGATYAKQAQGPVPKQVLPAIDHLVDASRLNWENVSLFDFVKREFVAHGDTDDSVFSKSEIECFDYMIASIDKMSAKEISEISHTIIWRAAELGETLPYDSFLVSYLGDVTDEDMVDVQASLKEVEQQRGEAYG